MSKIDDLLCVANGRLKAGNVGLIIFKRGNKLSLRGMLPAKPGSGKTGFQQQTISLGLYANAAGIKIAEKEALKLSGLIALNQFDWADYTNSKKAIGSIGYWLLKFEGDYFNKRQRNEKSETTWRDYKKIFNKLDPEEKLTKDSLMAAILSTQPDSRTRKRACTYLKKLALFAGLDFDPSDYKGNYSADSVDIRNIPSDAEIQQWRDKMPIAYGLRYAFGLMAAYGLRNYELSHIDLESLKKTPRTSQDY